MGWKKCSKAKKTARRENQQAVGKRKTGSQTGMDTANGRCEPGADNSDIVRMPADADEKEPAEKAGRQLGL